MSPEKGLTRDERLNPRTLILISRSSRRLAITEHHTFKHVLKKKEKKEDLFQ